MLHQKPKRDCSFIRWLWLDGTDILVCFPHNDLYRFTLKSTEEATRIYKDIIDAESPKEAFERLLLPRPFRGVPIC